VQKPYASIAKKLPEVLRRRFGDGLASLVVFGSAARVDARADGNLEVIIAAKGLPEGQLGRSKLFNEVERELPMSWAPRPQRATRLRYRPQGRLLKRQKGFSTLYAELKEDALILYDKEDFFSKVLERGREALRELGHEGAKLGGAWYWMKRDYKESEMIKYE